VIGGYLLPGTFFNLDKLEQFEIVVGVHIEYFLLGRCAKYLDDFDQLIDGGLAQKDGFA
jgi:hypothetical protein